MLTYHKKKKKNSSLCFDKEQKRLPDYKGFMDFEIRNIQVNPGSTLELWDLHGSLILHLEK